MKRLATAIVSLALLAGVLPTAAGGETAPAHEPIAFGMDSNSIAAQTAAGVKPDYGTFWVGPWTLKYGWGGADSRLTDMRSQGVTPAIHFYYWGDDISQDCIENGCYSSLHDAWKDKAGWDRLANELVQHLQSRMGGEPVVIFMETEFNKADVQYYEPLDGYLAAKAAQIHQGYPEAHVVLSLGSWNSGAWPTWDRAAAASDAIGIQGMRGSTRDSLAHYQGLYEATVTNAGKLKSLFGKPVFIQDVALSTYPEPEYLTHQKNELQQFFSNLDELRAVGVEAIVYRSWRNTNMDLNNYYGMAERHWGFAYQDGTYKPSAQVWIDGVKAERAGTGGGGSTPPASLTAAFEPSKNVNEWWVDVRVTASNPLATVQAQHDEGPLVTLSKTSWGTYAKSFHAPAGGTMTYHATDIYGQTVSSDPYPWLVQLANEAPTAAFAAQAEELTVSLDAAASSDPDGDTLAYTWTLGDGATATGAQVQHTYAASGTYTVQLTVDDGKATAQTAKSVTVVRPNMAPTASFTATTDGMAVTVDGRGSSDPDGDALAYTWDFGDGGTGSGVTSEHRYEAAGAYTVTLTVDDGVATATAKHDVRAEAPVFTATFEPSKNVNTWWVDVRVDASAPPAKVQASHDGGAWVTLSKTSWGTYAKSFYVPPGTMAFRAIDASGTTVTGDTLPWLRPDLPDEPGEPGDAPEPPTEAFSADFTMSGSVNTWWVDVRVSASATPVKVEASNNGGPWVALSKTSWGTYAKSFYAPAGTMAFRATDAAGQTVTSETMPWLKTSFEATFTPKPGNPWWVETKVDANEGVTKVQASINGGPWKDLTKRSWGSYADSFNVGKHGKVQFRAVSVSGDTATSSVYDWA